MASWVLSECGLRPLTRIYPKPRIGQASLNSNPSKLRISRSDFGNISSSCLFNGLHKERNWALKVSAPPRLQQETKEGERVINGGEEFFDPAAPPPFKLSDIKNAIPKHCWVKDPWKSMRYVVRDVAVVMAAAYFNNWIVWPLYWFAQGTMFWALFVLGHDCGHGSFSNDPKLNIVVGHLLHSSILVPYHGWRISHRTHHQNHGHVENDESWHPQASYQQITRNNVRALLLKTNPITSSSGVVELRQLMNRKRSGYCISVANGDEVATETTEKDSKTIEGSYSDALSSDNLAFANSSKKEDKIGSSDESGLAPHVSEDCNGSVNSTNLNQDTSASTSRSTLKRAPLTARERLRAARVLNRYTEPKPSKPELGSKLLEVLKETDKGKKRPGLPEAPTNLLDDSKRGLPEQGWTINIIPGGMDVFLIIFSFVFISSVMFATTYIVWKVGAIHFNEY